MKLAAAALVVLAVAGCGSTRTVTRTVHPCAGVAGVARCLAGQATMQAAYNGATASFHVHCAPAAKHRFKCTAAFMDNCYQAIAARTPEGVTVLLVSAVVDPTICATVFGKA
jgi:hypothetical protein